MTHFRYQNWYLLAMLALLRPLEVSSSSDQMSGLRLGSDDDDPHIASTTLSRRRLSTTSLQCTTPDQQYYHAKFTVRTEVDGLRACTQLEADELRDTLDLHFDQLAAYDEQLGPIEMLRNGPSCDSTGRRRLNTPPNETQAAVLESSPTTANRQLGLLRTGYFFQGDGACRYCRGDTSDQRRRLTGNAPTFISIHTDQFPNEMSWNIKTTSGQVLFSGSNYALKNHAYMQTVYLNAGQHYVFNMNDSYGDGWCCTHGRGGAFVFAGTGPSEMQLINIGNEYANFGAGKSIPFTAVSEGLTAQQREALDPNYVAHSAFPLLEEQYSNYISFYLQQKYHMDTTHCLYGTYPDVYVDFDPISQSSSQSVCP